MSETPIVITELPKSTSLLRKAKKIVVVSTVAGAALVLTYAAVKKTTGKAVDVEVVDA